MVDLPYKPDLRRSAPPRADIADTVYAVLHRMAREKEKGRTGRIA